MWHPSWPRTFLLLEVYPCQPQNGPQGMHDSWQNACLLDDAQLARVIGSAVTLQELTRLLPFEDLRIGQRIKPLSAIGGEPVSPPLTLASPAMVGDPQPYSSVCPRRV